MTQISRTCFVKSQAILQIFSVYFNIFSDSYLCDPRNNLSNDYILKVSHYTYSFQFFKVSLVKCHSGLLDVKN